MEKTADKIARALRHLSVETGSLACLGCGHEHNCSTHGCAILRDAADMIIRLNDFDQSQSKIALERCQKAEAQLAAEKAKYAELQRYNTDCTKQCDALLAEKMDLKNQLAASKQRGSIQSDNRMAKAFALLCRVLDDFAGPSPCQVRQTDWPECNGESEQCGDRPIWQCWQKYILERVDAEPVCRVCGCTQNNACPGGCYWVEPDLCSACAEAAMKGGIEHV